MKNIILITGLLIIAGGIYTGMGLFKKVDIESRNDNIYKTSGNTNQKSMGNPHVILKTNKGDIEIELFADKAPKTVANFAKLASEKFYDGTRFHRVIKDFMIQGGDPLSKDVSASARWGTGGPGYKFDDEINDVLLVRGILAMANAGPDTNGSQFFIVTAESTPWLDGKHAAFGKVVNGMNVVLAIESSKVGQNDQPVEEIVLKSVTDK